MLAALHAGAALFHHWVLRDRTLLLRVITYFAGLYFGWKILEPLGFFNVEVKRG